VAKRSEGIRRFENRPADDQIVCADAQCIASGGDASLIIYSDTV
jgi:hypothetical protein